jgi:DNA-3-methyladenine glycosylase II
MPSPIINAGDIAALKRRDELFSAIAGRYGDPPNWKRRPGFVSLCRISRQKASHLRSLSEAVVEGRLAFSELGRQDLRLTRRQLTAVKGIGQWTADIYSMFCLQAKDIFPLGDVAVMSAAIELHPGSARFDIEALSERWKPYRSLAACYFWRYYLSARGRSA